jgi:hypothetical protein
MSGKETKKKKEGKKEMANNLCIHLDVLYRAKVLFLLQIMDMGS